MRVRCGETEAHKRLKRLALVWAQTNGYTACAEEVRIPRCNYRADIAAFRKETRSTGATAIFECKQARADLRRDSCCAEGTRKRIASVQHRRDVLERCLRTHYPTLRTGESLFPEYDVYDFAATGHRAYARVVRELASLRRSLHDGTKFECLARYRCADALYLVVPQELAGAEPREGWGVLVEDETTLIVLRKPARQQTDEATRLQLLQRIAAAGTRQLNRQLAITFDELERLRRQRS